MNIRIEKAKVLKKKPSWDNLGFGIVFTDHMFIMDYTEGEGWVDPRIVPYQKIELDPAAMVLHYGQETFEGLKAYRTKDDEIQLFRPEKNINRINITNERTCIPQVDEGDLLQAIKAVVEVEQDWVPDAPGTSLYIRPYIIATEPCLGIRPSFDYKLVIILSPVGAYYKEGINPVSIWVEGEYARTVRGGLGYAKTGANYVAGFKAQMKAKEKGYAQVLWLDGVERKYVEEVGMMNVFFIIDGEVITPLLEGSILEGVTRDSVIELLEAWDISITERKLSIDEIYKAGEEGRLSEAFGTGTAAAITPIGLLDWSGRKLSINSGEIGDITKRIHETITGVQFGKIEDQYGWAHKVVKQKSRL